jgi:hypothetical protein
MNRKNGLLRWILLKLKKLYNNEMKKSLIIICLIDYAWKIILIFVYFSNYKITL